MALFAYVYVLKQTNVYVELNFNGNDGNFAERQLQHGTLREFQSTFATNGTYQNSSIKKFSFRTIYGDSFEKNFKELQNYIQAKNFSNVYEYLYSFAKIACKVGIPSRNKIQFVRHLIRYRRICQVKQFET